MSESILFQEICEQPQAIERLIEAESEHVRKLGAKLKGHFKYALLAARGTSDNAARYAQYLFQIYNKLPVALATPSVFSVYQSPPILDEALVVAISQSGMSPDIIAVIEEARRQNRPTLAITNDPQSPLAKVAEDVIPLHVGPERAVAATKTYTGSLVALALLSCGLLEDCDMLDKVKRLPGLMEEALKGLLPLVGRMERYRYMEHCAVIGRGYNYSTAFEISLKIKELTGIAAEPYSSADFLHGPIATVHRSFPVLVVAPHGMVFEDMVEIIQKVKERGAELLTVSDDEEINNLAQFPMPIPGGIPEWLSPIVAVLPGQLMGWQLALQKGLDPDKPRGLSKVTETY